VGDLRRLIVFDLDGTLVDSRRDLADAANALILERGGQPLSEEAVGRMVGEGARVLVQRALSTAGLTTDADSLPRFLELYDQRLLKTTIPYAGIPAALEMLAAHAVIAVLTNKPLAPSVRILEALDLSRFVAATIGGDGPFPKKPDPAPLLHLVDAFGVSPQATVMVGDSWVDWETARHAGTAICLARYGFGYHTADPARLRGDEALVDDPVALAEVISSLHDIS
jgi:phosphoglycolate phosphatase